MTSTYLLDGSLQRLTLRASEEFVAEINAEHLSITNLKVDSWPVMARAATLSR